MAMVEMESLRRGVTKSPLAGCDFVVPDVMFSDNWKILDCVLNEVGSAQGSSIMHVTSSRLNHVQNETIIMSTVVQIPFLITTWPCVVAQDSGGLSKFCSCSPKFE
ncbi:hypothetical protein M758_3G229300 [Ceratodon purpureus]|nr:hypothetical protein M758_3G229300 [Ceratodon purpureus]